VLAARWDAVDAELADVTITAYVTASVLDVPLPATVGRLHDSLLTLTEEGHVLAICAAAAAVAAAWRRYAGMARRLGDLDAVAAGLADLHRWLRRTAVVLDIDLPDACARKAAVILTRGWREPRRLTGRGWAYGGALLGGAVPIAANVAHSYVPPPGAPAGWHPQGGAVFGAVCWPVFLFVAIEILAKPTWPDSVRFAVLRYLGLLPVALVAAGVSYRHLSGLLAFYREDPLTVAIGRWRWTG
jgi:hypothetical protein